MAGVDILASAFSGANAAFLGEQYARWATEPGSVDPTFAELFGALNDDARAVLEEATGASWAPHHVEPSGAEPGGEPTAPVAPSRPPARALPAAAEALSQEQIRAATIASLRALMLIRSYRVRGHLEARLDPLGLLVPPPHPELDPRTYGFTDADLDKPIFIDNVLGRETATLREIVQILRDTYCGSIAVEFMHIQDPDQKSWIQRRVEGAPWRTAFDPPAKRRILQQLTEAEGFEAFCQKRYTTTKRFGLDGGEVTIPALHAIIETVAAQGVKEIAIGMPHRGRLNTLVNIVKKPFIAVFSEFTGESSKPDEVQGSGDVKYHLGTSTDVEIAGPQRAPVAAAEPVASGSGRPGGGRQGARPAGHRRRHPAAQFGDGARDAWRRRLRRPGPGVRDAGDEPAHRLPHRRHGPRDRQQPDRLHHRAGARLFRAVLHRRGEVDPGADPARQRRRPRSGDVLRPHGGGVPHALRHATSCWTSSATAAMATTRPTSRPSPSR